jgi:hypothetical protein
LDNECTQLAINQDSFIMPGDMTVRFSQSVISCDKMDSAEEWEQGILAAYVTYNVPEADQVLIPMEAECLTSACPTEEDWCKTDPECSESPYKEPEGSVESGAIAGFTVAGILLLITALYGLHAVRAKQQEKRYKTKFVKRMADTIDLRASMRQLGPKPSHSSSRRSIVSPRMVTFRKRGCGPCQLGKLATSPSRTLTPSLRQTTWTRAEQMTFWSFAPLWASAATSIARHVLIAGRGGSCVSPYLGGRCNCSPSFCHFARNGRCNKGCGQGSSSPRRRWCGG